MPLTIEMFPPIIVEIQKEIQNHPRLQLALHNLPEDAPLEERFAVILAYCGMVVDGYYNNDAIERLCEIALDKLKKMGTVRILTH